MSRKLSLLIKILIASTFFVPLIVLPASYIFPFIVPKIVWFRALTMLMLGGYVLLLSINWQEYKIKFTPLTLVVGLFLLSFAVSTFVGVDWYKSFWDNHERMLGLFTLVHFFIYYLVISSVIKEWRDWQWLLRIFLAAGSLVMFIGFWQKYVDDNALLNQGADRVSATLGNAIYFSGYGLFLFFIGLLLFLEEKKSQFYKWFAAGGGLLGFFGIFWGGTRGTLLGLLVGFLVMCVIYFFTLKEYPKVRKIISIIFAGGVLVVALLLFFRSSTFVQKIPGVDRLINTDFNLKNSTVPRVMAWGVAWQGFLEKPVFGWGPNNFYYTFNKYYRPEFLESGWGETWFDNAHNIVMNTLDVQGAVGIILYFALFGLGFYSLWWNYKNQGKDVHFFAIGSAFLVGHFVNNITVFEDPTSYLYFFFFLALVNGRVLLISKEVKTEKKKNFEYKPLSAGLTVVVCLLTALLIYSTDVKPAEANQATLGSIKTLYSNPSTALQAYQTAVDIDSPHIDDIRNDFARTLSQAVTQLIQQNKDLDLAKKFADFGLQELTKNRELHPLDIRVHLQQTQLLMQLAQLTKDQKYLTEAESVLTEAYNYSPKRQQIIFTLAQLKAQRGDFEGAYKLLRQVVDDDPKIEENWWRLILFLSSTNNVSQAKAVIAEAEKQGIVWGETGKSIVNEVRAMTTTTKK